MANIAIVGGGISAVIAKIFIDEPVVVLSCSSPMQPGNALSRNKNLEINKLFSTRSYSLSALKFNLLSGSLHDRLSLGGNSKIWGGFIDITGIPAAFLDRLTNIGISFKTLTFSGTGSISNNLNIGQLQSNNNQIVDASNLLQEHQDFFLDSFHISDKGIGLNLRSGSVTKSMSIQRLVLCVGVVQMIDLLYRSNFIGDNDEISLSEFSYKLVPRFTLRPHEFSGEDAVIRFKLFRAASHFLGIQKLLWVAQSLNWIPFYFDQVFYPTKNNYALRVNQGVIYDLESRSGLNKSGFGASIHYCDMRINGITLNDFLKKISPSVSGLGMAFVQQERSGPISNDIIKDALRKFKVAC